MNVTVKRAEFLRALSACSSVVTKSISTPILEGVRVIANDDGLRIAGTDLELTIQVRCPADVRERGSFVLDLVTLMKFTQSAPDKTVSLEMDKRRATLQITSGTASFTIPVLDAADYPVLPEPGDAPAVAECEVELLAQGCRAVLFAASDGFDVTSSGLKMPKGLLLRFVNSKVEFCATDGKRIAYACAAKNGEEWLGDIVSTRAARAIMKFPAAGNAVIRHDTRHAFFECDDRSFSYRRQDASFPDFTRYTSAATTPDAIIADRKRLVETVQRVLLLTPSHRGIELDARAGRLTIRPLRNERGDGSDFMPCDGDTELRVSLSGTSLVQALEATGTERVSVGVGAETMIIIRSVADDLDGTLESLHYFAPQTKGERQ